MGDAATHDSVEGIAIIGMSGRFPGAGSISEFWRNLREGVESISFFTDEELESSGVSPSLLGEPNYVGAKGVIDDVELFDASFFGYTPREAEVMDPQHRIFMECAWEALENSGYDPETSDISIGVYAGVSMNTYLTKNILPNREFTRSLGGWDILIASDKDFLATRLSYKFNLKGPSLVVQTACSTSLVAVAQACQSLLCYQCDMALAGGVCITVPTKTGYLYQEEGIASPDGHCRAFDTKARGTVAGNGVGIVALKRLAEALEDGDTVYAVIRGSAVNNDGSLKVGYTAPSVEGQARAIAMAQALAGVEAETIAYVEAHGTGTALGDPIEIAALTQAFRASTDKKGFCAIGSVKTNIGHLDAAAGVAGLIKTALALQHGELPPSLHFEEPNPKIDFADSPFRVNSSLAEWRRGDTPRRAGVSSFGIGGTNAHVVLEEAPARVPSGESRPWQLVVLSAKTNSALETVTANLAEHLKSHSHLNLADVAYTLQVGRKRLGHRRALVCQDSDDAISALQEPDSRRILTGVEDATDRPVVFMFSGQGAQYVNMGWELYQAERTFREHVDRCCEILEDHLGCNLRDVLYPPEDGIQAATERLTQTSITQPALFVFEYALARLWMQWNVRPEAMIGHSIGEYVAACLAGVFSLEDALRLVAARGRLMQRLPRGAMLAVPLPERRIASFLGEHLSLAAVNEPSLCVVSGPLEAVHDLEAQLSKEGVQCRRLHTSHAFHSAMMEPVLGSFTDLVRQMDLHPPEIPYLSNSTGTWIQASQATDPGYWGRHIRETVRFAAGLQELYGEPTRILLEVGPGRTLSTVARRHPERPAGQAVLSSVRHPQERQSDLAYLMNAIGRLWVSGARLDWRSFHAQERRHRIPLPTYPFERQRYWIKAQDRSESVASPAAPLSKKPDIGDWFYTASWKRSAPPVWIGKPDLGEEASRWLVFSDTAGLARSLTKRLERLGQEVLVVRAGDGFARQDDSTFTIDPVNGDDYGALIKLLAAQGKIPNRMVHLWTVTSGGESLGGNEALDKILALGFYSLVFLAQAIGNQNITDPVQMTVVSDNMHEVTGEEALCPAKAAALGPCRTIPKEYPNITCRNIDIDFPESRTIRENDLLDRLLAEITSGSPDPVVAHRGVHRWVQTAEPIRLAGKEGRPVRLRDGGVYLITGGFGGIGLALAEYLAETVSAKLVLTGRSALPDRDRWEQWLATHGESDDISRRIQRVRALEALGAEVLAAGADVSDREQMQAVILKARERFGRIHGVIHAAGVAGRGPIQLKTPGMAATVLAPKVKGTLVLESLFEDAELDFLLLCSSLASILAGFGQVDYCAANAFLDSFACHKKSSGDTLTTSVNWDTWSEAGMAFETELPGLLNQRRDEQLKNGIRSREGVEVFARILDCAVPQILVSTRDLSERMERNRDPVLSSEPEDQSERADASEPSHARPALVSSYVAPRNELEEAIADIWQTLFGIERVGIHDDFYELGGHSLLATQLLNKLNRAYDNARLSLRSILDNPTVAALAQLIDGADRQEVGADEKPISELLLGAPAATRSGLIEEYVKAQIAGALDKRIEQLPIDGNLAEFDSEMFVTELISVFKRDFRIPVYPHEIRERLSIKALARFLGDELDRMSGALRKPSAITSSPAALEPSPAYRPAGRESVKRPASRTAPRNDKVIFLLSAPRSGSTLLRLMLAGHSSLVAPPELGLLAYEGMRQWNERTLSRFPREVVRNTFMALLDVDLHECEALLDDWTERDMPVQEVYRLIQDRAGPRTLVDKAPGYAMSLHTLERAEQLFRRPMYIHLVRHPYAVIESFVRNRMDKLVSRTNDDPYAVAEEQWMTCTENIVHFSRKLDKGRYYLIRYEDLVLHPARAAGKLCEFLKIPFEETLLHPYEGQRMIVGPGDPDILEHEGIDPSLGEVWKRITLPRRLSERTQRLALGLDYELPHDVAEPEARSGRGDRLETEQRPTGLDQLTDEQVDALLRKTLRRDEVGE